MSFSIDIQAQFNFKRIRITNNATQVYIDIISKGGLLNSWTQSPEKQGWDIIDGNSFENGWDGFESTGFKSGKMNPFSCRLQHGQYQHKDKHYTIDKYYLGDHAIHGIVYDANFEISSTNIENNKASVTLQYDCHNQDRGYPFKYSVQLHWTFWEQNKITVQTIITNQDTVSFPMMDGWHPYFKLGDSVNDCTIQLTNKGVLEYDDALIPTGNILPHTAFENPKNLAGIELDNGYVLDMNNPSCSLENEDYKLVVTPIANYPYLQLYIPPSRKSIAIENLSGAPDCFNNKMGLHIMQPQSVWILETSFQLFYK
jgi:aldose 1-epimerase